MLDISLYNMTGNVNTVFAILTQHFIFDHKFWIQIILISQYILLRGLFYDFDKMTI